VLIKERTRETKTKRGGDKLKTKAAVNGENKKPCSERRVSTLTSGDDQGPQSRTRREGEESKHIRENEVAGKKGEPKRRVTRSKKVSPVTVH